MEIFPEGAVTTVTSGFMTVVTANIAVVLGLLAFFLAIKFVRGSLNRGTKGKL